MPGSCSSFFFSFLKNCHKTIKYTIWGVGRKRITGNKPSPDKYFYRVFKNCEQVFVKNFKC